MGAPEDSYDNIMSYRLGEFGYDYSRGTLTFYLRKEEVDVRYYAPHPQIRTLFIDHADGSTTIYIIIYVSAIVRRARAT